jgi:hypothetical protein
VSKASSSKPPDRSTAGGQQAGPRARATAPVSPEHQHLLALQRHAGNQAVAGMAVQRIPDPADPRAWATEVNGRVEGVQDAVLAAQTRLNAEARVAIEALRSTQRVYDSYEKRYDTALATFKKNVESAQAAETMLREVLQLAATFALAEFVPLYTTATKAVSGVTETIDKAVKATRAGRTAAAGAGVAGVVLAPEPSKESSKDITQSATDWKGLVSTALSSYQTNLDGNTSLATMSRDCITTVRFLGRVRDGSFAAGVDPRTTPEGQQADAFGTNAAAVQGHLATIGTGSVSNAAVAFNDAATRELDRVTVPELEKQIATKWISSLGPGQLDEIDTAEAYLKSIKVIGPGSTLGYDTGVYTTGDDEQMIKMLADIETMCRSMVGQSAEWLGKDLMSFIGGGGRIRDSHNRTWAATAPPGISQEGGGSVTITGYRIDKSMWDMDSWEWSRPADLKQQLLRDVTFRIVTNGPTGGGATAPGPVLNAL